MAFSVSFPDRISYLRSFSVLLAGYLVINRNEELRDYLLDKTPSLGFIGLVAPYARDATPEITLYSHGHSVKDLRAVMRALGGRVKPKELWPLFYLLDIASIVLTATRIRKRFDLYIGATYGPTLAGLVLKRLKFVERVVYYSYDYIQPPRESGSFGNRVMAAAFQIIDNLCISLSDVTWNLSEAIKQARRANLRKLRPRLETTVPHPIRPKLTPSSKLNHNKAVYVGFLRPHQGLELVIESVPEILRHIPDFKLFIIGSGPEEEKLRRLVERKRLEEFVRFFGFVYDEARLSEILSQCSLGIAMYAPTPHGLTRYLEPSKVKTYLEHDIPVVVSQVSATAASQLETRGVAVCVPYDVDALTRMITMLLKKRSLLYEMRDRIAEFIDEFSAEKIFENAFATSAPALIRNALTRYCEGMKSRLHSGQS